jgi:hypothetical protein
MQRFHIRIVLGVALLAVGFIHAGCYPKAGPPPEAVSGDKVTSASTRWPGVTESSLAAGRETFLAKCNGCHDYPDLAAIPDEDWPAIIERMGKKAELDAAKTDEVLHFVLASKASPAGS